MAFTSDLFTGLANEFTTKLGDNLFASVGSFISSIAPLFSIGFGIYILLVVINAYGRGFDENVMDLAKRSVGWLIVIAFAFNAGQYAKLANLIYAMPEELASTFSVGKYNISAFDASAAKLEELVAQLYKLDDSQPPWEFGFHMAVNFRIIPIVLVCGYILLGASFAYYVVAKVCLALVIMVGPLFLGSMLFPATRQYGMNWIGQCLNYVVMVVMFTILGLLQTAYFDQQINKYLNQGVAGDIVVAEGLPSLFIIVTIFFLLVAWKIPSITSALTGGASLEGFASTVVRMAMRAKFGGLGGGAARGGSIARGR